VKKEQWHSPDPIVRADVLRLAIRLLAARHNVDEAHLARSVGLSRQRWNRMMELGKRGGPHAADVPILSAELGEDDELLAILAGARGRGLFPLETTTEMAPDAFASARAALVAVSDLVAATSNLTGRAPTAEESQQIAGALARARAHLAKLEGQVGAVAPSRLKGVP